MENEMPDLKKIEEYASKSYDAANCEYNGHNYYYHINMVVNNVVKYKHVFIHVIDALHTEGAAHTHDLIEDAKQTHSDIAKVCGKDIADITLAVTDITAENRFMRHLHTMPRTVKDHRAIILKLCDILANATASKMFGSNMYYNYVEEYAYRKPIFTKALSMYKNKFNDFALIELFDELDNVHDISK